MYAYIKGKINNITPQYVVIENNGVGFLIIVPNPYVYSLNEETIIYTHHYVKEDINNLYGFKTEESKSLFLKLISVNGIGPKTGLSILATDDANGIALAIESGDAKYLTKFPGIGNKTAQQIILDLKGKINIDENFIAYKSNLNDAELALLALGYANASVKKVLKQIDDTLPVEDIIKKALTKLLN